MISATATDTIDLEEIKKTPHVFIGVEFQDGGGSPVTPGAGTFSITIKTAGTNTFESIIDGDDIDATMPLDALSFATNAIELRYTPIGITGAVNVQLTILGNSS